MLLNTPNKQGDVVTLKTAGGEEIIARFQIETNSYIKVEKPMVVVANGQGIGLMPYSFTISPDAEVELNISAIVFCHKTDEDMAKQYLQSSTGISLN